MIRNTKIEKNKGIALALGYFDGMHLGHRKLISALVSEAKKMNIKTAVITFSDNPANYFSDKKIPNIQTDKDRAKVLEDLGVDYLYELDFGLYKNMTAEDYIKNILIKNFEPKLIVAGYNHTLGSDKKSAAFINENSNKYKYRAIILPEYLYKDTEEVSSSIIRKHIEYGHLNATNALLGKNFTLCNTVIKGKKLATNLGYPTANLVWPDSIVKLPYGVYFGYAKIEDRIIPSLIAWGIKPTLSTEKEEKLEAHLYDFNKDIYGKIMTLIFVKKLRGEIHFANAAELKEQLANDYDEFQRWAKAKFG